MQKLLMKFKKMEIDKLQLKIELGEDLYNIDCPKPEIISCCDLINVIKAYIDKKIPLERLVEWVNVIWFTDLYEISEKESDSIMSVLEVLETLDEEEVTVATKDFLEMIKSLSQNNIYN